MTVALNDQQAAGLKKVRLWYEDAMASTEKTEVFRWFGYGLDGRGSTSAIVEA
jgi:hypothetical protein